MEPNVTIKPRHRYKAGCEQAEDDDDHTADQVCFVKMRAQESAQRGRTGPEQDEHGREADNEAEAEAAGSAPRRHPGMGRNPVSADRAPSDIGYIARY